MARPFKGTIHLDIRDSKPDWDAFLDTMPDVVDGVKQTPLPGVSMRYSFDDASAPTGKKPSTTRC
jgi:hypothetical protein